LVAGAPDAASVLSQARGENFPVASRLLPRQSRRHLLAIYGFARLADDLGDEATGDRSALLDWLEQELDLVYRGAPRHALTRELQASVREKALPREPFERLIEANRRDQHVHRYASAAALFEYCELSANPVGHLVLHVFEAATPDRLVLSDHVCTALQLTEHWQDVREDLARGRRYLPAEDLARFGCPESQLRGVSAGPAARALLRFEVARTRSLFDAGAPLVGTLHGAARLCIAAFVAGGRAALDAIERRDFDVLSGLARPRRLDFARRLAEVLRRERLGGRLATSEP